MELWKKKRNEEGEHKIKDEKCTCSSKLDFIIMAVCGKQNTLMTYVGLI